MKLNLVTEWCGDCNNEITMDWEVKERGFKAYCPVCGNRLMLCDECQHRDGSGMNMNDCRYDEWTGKCRFSRTGFEEEQDG